MTAGKIILYAIIGLMGFYIWQEYDITKDVVKRENHRYYKENKSAIEFTKKALAEANKKGVKKEEVLAEKDSTDDLYEKMYAYISGKIDKSMGYKIEVLYHATSDDRLCKKESSSWNGGGLVPLSEDFEYFPKLEGEKHEIEVPLSIFDPRKKCQFKPYLVRMYIFTRDNKRENHSVVLFTDNTEMYANQGFHKRWYNNHKIDMECIEPAPFPSSHYTPCGIKPIDDQIAIMRHVPKKTLFLELNLDKLPLESLSQEELRHILRR